VGTLNCVIVGANAAGPGGAPLRYAERDALVLCESLTSQRLYESVALHTHIGRHAASEILNSVIKTAQAAGPQDSIIFFYAGHGIREFDEEKGQQLLLAAGLGARVTGQDFAVPLAQVFDLLSGSHAKCVVILLDCCFSGQPGGRSVLGPKILSMLASGRPLLQVPAPPLPGEGRVVLSASRHDEPAREARKYRHGIFSYALLSELGQAERSERTDRIDVASLYVDVRRTVLQKTNGSQCPTLSGGDQGAELPTFRLRG